MAPFEIVWFPDTCSCVITRLEPDGSGSATLGTLNRIGAEHGTLIGTNVFAAVIDENGRKNQMVTVASSFIGSLQSKNIAWAFNASRVLLFSFPGTSVSSVVKTNIQNAADLQFGTGKVAVS